MNHRGMKKEKLLELIKDFLGYIIVMIILLLVENKLGLYTMTGRAIIDNIIGLAFGWIIWKIVMTFINKRNRQK